MECINLVFNVLAGGVDTSQSQLAHTVRLLAEHPEQWAALRADPSLASAAVEEALRYEPITPFTARIVDEEITFREVTFPRETIVMVCAFTGNRDSTDDTEIETDTKIKATAPERRHSTSQPIDRQPAPLTFGAGVHYCLGANFARAELEEAVAFLAQRFHTWNWTASRSIESITGIYGLGAAPGAVFRLARIRVRERAESAGGRCLFDRHVADATDSQTEPPRHEACPRVRASTLARRHPHAACRPDRAPTRAVPRDPPPARLAPATRVLPLVAASRPGASSPRRRPRLSLTTLPAAPVSTARAGQYHAYTCRTPSGEPAPTDGWSPSINRRVAYDDLRQGHMCQRVAR